MRPLTKAQKAVLHEMKQGQRLIKAFDVWRGYFWFLEPSRSKVNKATAEILVDRYAIVPGEDQRIYSGYREQTWSISKENQ